MWNHPHGYAGEEPYFWETSVFRGSSDFESHWEAIKRECVQFLVDKKMEPYFKSDMVKGTGAYRTLSLRWWDINFYKNQRQIPVLSTLLNKYPEIMTLSINVLEPHTSINPHMGDTNGIYRAHFALEIPSALPDCGLRVGGESRSWQEGKWVFFTDAFMHEAWNHTNTQRIILLVDVLRPEFTSQRKSIAATVMTSLFLQKRFDKHLILNPHQSKIIRWIAPILVPLVRFRIAMLNFFKKY